MAVADPYQRITGPVPTTRSGEPARASHRYNRRGEREIGARIRGQRRAGARDRLDLGGLELGEALSPAYSVTLSDEHLRHGAVRRRLHP